EPRPRPQPGLLRADPARGGARDRAGPPGRRARGPGPGRRDPAGRRLLDPARDARHPPGGARAVRPRVGRLVPRPPRPPAPPAGRGPAPGPARRAAAP
ncbi:MAG: hypothetical protein AVDCRST_MAG13-1239, partial [uncultured Solirubrobacteraceae bacterium]